MHSLAGATGSAAPLLKLLPTDAEGAAAALQRRCNACGSPFGYCRGCVVVRDDGVTIWTQVGSWERCIELVFSGETVPLPGYPVVPRSIPGEARKKWDARLQAWLRSGGTERVSLPPEERVTGNPPLCNACGGPLSGCKFRGVSFASTGAGGPWKHCCSLVLAGKKTPRPGFPKLPKNYRGEDRKLWRERIKAWRRSGQGAAAAAAPEAEAGAGGVASEERGGAGGSGDAPHSVADEEEDGGGSGGGSGEENDSGEFGGGGGSRGGGGDGGGDDDEGFFFSVLGDQRGQREEDRGPWSMGEEDEGGGAGERPARC